MARMFNGVQIKYTARNGYSRAYWTVISPNGVKLYAFSYMDAVNAARSISGL